jgi:Spy/CpxP family protein refolding chaperone
MFLKCTALVAGLFCALTFQAAAQQGGGGGGQGGRGMILTQDQNTQLREAIQADMTPLREKLNEAQKEAVKAALAADASEAAVKAKVEAVYKIQAEMAMVRFKALKKVSLTADQKSQLESSPMGFMSMFGMGGGFGARGNRGGGGGGGGGAQQ